MTITLVFLLVALAAYTIFGGADFGGGLLEASFGRRRDLQAKLQATLAPVWEANHVWLIAVVVILFVGFPGFYAELSTMLFVPISLALVGIILRGAFFTFRKYDPEPEKRERLYGWLFRTSSALTPMMFGFIVAALLRPFPVVGAKAGATFGELFMAPWATSFGVCCALFVYALFGYVAAVFFYGEPHDDESRSVIRARVLGFFVATYLTGGAVLTLGVLQGVVDIRAALSPIQITCQVAAFAAIVVLLWSMSRRVNWLMRAAVGAQVMAILAGWFATQHPVFMRFTDGTLVTVSNSAAPAITLQWLNVGLTGVLLLVLPGLIYLYRVFGRASATP